MRVAALLPIGALLCLVIVLPVASLVIQDFPSLGAVLADPKVRAAVLRSLSLGASGVAIGWPAGFLAAFGIWGRGRLLRRLVLGSGLLLVALPPFLDMPVRTGLAGGSAAMLLAAHAAPAAAIALVVLTVGLDRLDPHILRSAAACGATPWQSWRLGLWPALGWAPWLAAVGGFALCALTAWAKGAH